MLNQTHDELPPEDDEALRREKDARQADEAIRDAKKITDDVDKIRRTMYQPPLLSSYTSPVLLPTLRTATLRSATSSISSIHEGVVVTAYGIRTTRQSMHTYGTVPLELERILKDIGFEDLPYHNVDDDHVHTKLLEYILKYVHAPIVNPFTLHKSVDVIDDLALHQIPVFPGCATEQLSAIKTIFGPRHAEFYSRVRSYAAELSARFAAAQVANAAFGGNDQLMQLVNRTIAADAKFTPVGHMAVALHAEEYEEIYTYCEYFMRDVVTIENALTSLGVAFLANTGIRVPRNLMKQGPEFSQLVYQPFSTAAANFDSCYSLITHLYDAKCIGVNSFQDAISLVTHHCELLLSSRQITSSLLRTAIQAASARVGASSDAQLLVKLGTTSTMSDFYIYIFAWYIAGRGHTFRLDVSQNMVDLDMIMYITLRAFLPRWAIENDDELSAKLAIYTTPGSNLTWNARGNLLGAINTLHLAYANETVGLTIFATANPNIAAASGMPARTAQQWDTLLSNLSAVYVAMSICPSRTPVAMKFIGGATSMVHAKHISDLCFSLTERIAVLGDRWDFMVPVAPVAPAVGIGRAVAAPYMSSTLGMITLQPEGILSALIQTGGLASTEVRTAVALNSASFVAEARMYRANQFVELSKVSKVWIVLCWLICHFSSAYSDLYNMFGMYPATEFSIGEKLQLSMDYALKLVGIGFENSSAVISMIKMVIDSVGGISLLAGGAPAAFGNIVPNAVFAAAYNMPTLHDRQFLQSERKSFSKASMPGSLLTGQLGVINDVCLAKLSQCSLCRVFPETAETRGKAYYGPYVLCFNGATDATLLEWNAEIADDMPDIVQREADYAVDPADADGYVHSDPFQDVAVHSRLTGIGAAQKIRVVRFSPSMTINDSMTNVILDYLNEPSASHVITMKASASVTFKYAEVQRSVDITPGVLPSLVTTSIKHVQPFRFTGAAGKYHKYNGPLDVMMVTTSDFRFHDNGVSTVSSDEFIQTLIAQTGEQYVVVPTLSSIRKCFVYQHTTYSEKSAAELAAAQAALDDLAVDGEPANRAYGHNFDSESASRLKFVVAALPVPLNEQHCSVKPFSLCSTMVNSVSPFVDKFIVDYSSSLPTGEVSSMSVAVPAPITAALCTTMSVPTSAKPPSFYK